MKNNFLMTWEAYLYILISPIPHICVLLVTGCRYSPLCANVYIIIVWIYG